MSTAREGEALSSGGTWLHFHAWDAPRPKRALAVVHGLGEHGGRYAALGTWLAERGTSVWAIDLRGMGQSGGGRGQLGSWNDWLDDARRLWTLAERASPDLEIIPLGHSVGGVVVSSAVLRGVLTPRRFVLSNPAFRIRMPVPGWKRALGAVAERATPRLSMPSGIDPRLLARDPSVGEAYVADPWVHDRLSARLYGEWMRAAREVLERAPDLPTPYLLLLSPEDPIIDPAASADFDGAAAVGQTVRRYPDRWHEPFQDLGREEVFADLLAWLLEREGGSVRRPPRLAGVEYYRRGMTATALPRSRPSDQNVDAQGLLDFLDAVEQAGMELHSLMVVRHGAVVAEGWWEPYRANLIHLLYSLSKSYTSTAIGIAEAEGRLSIDDLVLDHFPDEAPADPSPNLRAMRIRDLLAMASGHEEDTARRMQSEGPDLVRAFLALPLEHPPGTVFTYNQGCTHTLAVLVSRVSGVSLLDYLRPRLFDPLGIEQAVWTLAPDGVEQGWSGLHVTTESIAKLGQLYLQRGRWEGRQLVPEGYVEQATRKQVDNRPRSRNPDWQQGYGFQFWRCRGDAFRGDGASGQLCVVIPGREAVVACTAQTAEMQAELDLIWKHILPALRDGVEQGAATGAAEARLTERLGHLTTSRVEGTSQGPASRVVFEPRGDTEGLGTIQAEPVDGGIRLSIAHKGGETSLVAQPGTWTRSELPAIGRLRPPISVSAGWTQDRELRADVVFLTSPHRLSLRGVADAHHPWYRASWGQAPL